jgi:hypothetical protein
VVDLFPLLDWNGFIELRFRDPFWLLIPTTRRNTFSAGSMVGRQAETMPAAISIAVQPTVGARV